MLNSAFLNLPAHHLLAIHRLNNGQERLNPVNHLTVCQRPRVGVHYDNTPQVHPPGMQTLSLSRMVYFYQPDTWRDEPVILALTELAEHYPRYGFKTLFQLLLSQGNTWNLKRVHRIYCLLKLNFRRKGKQRLPVRNPAPLATQGSQNQSWSIDFMHDALVCGRRFRTFNVVDGFNREVLERIVVNCGYPLKMRMDNGPEPVSLAAEEHGVILDLLNRVNRRRKPLSNGSTKRTGDKYWIFICSER